MACPERRETVPGKMQTSLWDFIASEQDRPLSDSNGALVAIVARNGEKPPLSRDRRRKRLKLEDSDSALKAASESSSVTETETPDFPSLGGSPKSLTTESPATDCESMNRKLGHPEESSDGSNECSDALMSGRASGVVTPLNMEDAENSDNLEGVLDENLQALDDQRLNSVDREELNAAKSRIRKSMYVEASDTILSTVLDGEAYLFTEEEKEAFSRFRALSEDARLLFIRLFMRKALPNDPTSPPSSPSGSPTFDTSNPQSIKTVFPQLKPDESSKQLPDAQSPVLNQEAKRPRFFQLSKLTHYTRPTITSLYGIKDLAGTCNELAEAGFALVTKDVLLWSQLLPCLSLDEIKDIVKEVFGNAMLHQASSKRRDSFIQYICKSISSQNTLTKFAQSNSTSSRESLLLEKMLEKTGPVIAINPEYPPLFHRLHLVFYRSTQYNEQALTTSILASISKRYYPSYLVCRTHNIWKSRDQLLEYEAAIKLEKVFEDSVMAIDDTRRLYQTDTKSEEVAYLDDPPTRRRPRRKPSMHKPGDWKEKERELLLRSFEMAENIIPRWLELSQSKEKDKQDQKDPLAPFSNINYFLHRFEAGWIYTHIIEHACALLGRLHDHDHERWILDQLLAQKKYRVGKRGAWYDRLALLWGFHVGGRAGKKKALEVCVKGVEEVGMHLVYLQPLQRRIMRLESELKIPKREQHDFSYIVMRRAFERTVYGERLSDLTTGFKSLWRGDDGAECSVEECALGFYVRQGYRGFHSENSIITSLVSRYSSSSTSLTGPKFALLFWDILFMPCQGVFETQYQTAPLDLTTDAFYFGRYHEINERLRDISNGHFLNPIKTVDDRERPKLTLCRGLSWRFEQEDFLQIAECIGGPALAQICRAFAEEYEQRCGGFPDLFCWDYAAKKVKIVEVKGPGDRLSETQKVWIDLLLSAGLDVELCKVREWTAENELLEED
ncbi:hypothetical protein BZG36_00039 [Bifiguratus adelaidae]|uniref:Fanconi-associated nuclease n=1 Tax=Bifiguratus adelaidae TaxID=1938954 RepID=A0A261Y8N2_9FUNG|nr:hypothetical protein BZG36_00039 [Bifiguratus adelaidae]